MKKIIFASIIVAFVFSSCSKNLPDVGGTSAQRVANEWWCRLFVGNTDVGGGFHKVSTYNTSADADSIWVDDPSLYQFKVKAKANYSALTFVTSQANNEYYTVKVDLNGKVLLNAGHSKSGKLTDSIYMEAKFTDDPGTTYILRGTARTKYSEDDY